MKILELLAVTILRLTKINFKIKKVQKNYVFFPLIFWNIIKDDYFCSLKFWYHSSVGRAQD